MAGYSHRMLRRRQLEHAGRSDEHLIFFLRQAMHATTSFFLSFCSVDFPVPDFFVEETEERESFFDFAVVVAVVVVVVAVVVVVVAVDEGFVMEEVFDEDLFG